MNKERGNKERVNKERAFSAMKALGIPEKQVSPVLLNLLEVYEWNWEHIEADNYQALIDAVFDNENQGLDDKKECVVVQETPERPSKRLHLVKQRDNHSSAMASSSKTRAPEEAELIMTTSGQGSKKSSQPCLTGRDDKKECVVVQETPERPSKRLHLVKQRDNHSSAMASSSKTRAPEEAELIMTTSGQGSKKSSQPCLTGRDDKKECVVVQETPERPSKRLHLVKQRDNHSSAMASSSKTRAPEEAELIMTTSGQGSKKSSQPCLTGRDGSSSPISNEQLCCKRKDSTSSHLAPRERISTRSGKSQVVALKQPLDAHGSSCSSRENAATSTFNRKKLIQPKLEQPVNGITRHSERISVVCPGSLVGSSPEAVRNSLSASLSAPALRNQASRIVDSERDPNKKSLSHHGCLNSFNVATSQQRPITCCFEKRSSSRIEDITKGSENVQIALIDETCNEDLPKFTYIPHNIIYQNAYVHISLARISDEDCCSNCSGDCLSLSIPCACARETGGEFAYTEKGLLKEEFLSACMSMKKEPCEEHLVYCQDCPFERSNNEHSPEKCKGHIVRKFIKECWRKCGCSMQCRNRIVQRGITCKLQVFLTDGRKGWGLRTLQDLPKGTFVCEYVGEILTNTELYERNMQSCGSERHTYPVTLDADWGSERILRDEEALCLDATFCGNVARFINHRCSDANLIDIPVEVETPDRHYYHLAFFTAREVSASEELTWDYGIDFSDHDHPVKAFKCCCRSEFCRDVK